MATRSTIAVENPDGTITSIYVHWDGYPAYVGRVLLAYYTDPAKVLDLIANGDASSLGAEVGTRHDFDGELAREQIPEDTTYRVCTFYGRDRGETGVDATTHGGPCGSLVAWREDRDGVDYCYLFRPAERRWYFMPYASTDGLQPLTLEACDED